MLVTLETTTSGLQATLEQAYLGRSVRTLVAQANWLTLVASTQRHLYRPELTPPPKYTCS